MPTGAAVVLDIPTPDPVTKVLESSYWADVVKRVLYPGGRAGVEVRGDRVMIDSVLS
jgi:hypothetical protein